MNVVSAVEWMPVESGLFTSAAYRATARQLYLRLQDGNIYRYFDCPVTVYNEFVAAESKGRYFSRYIRNRFRHDLVRRGKTRVRDDENLPSLAEQLSASVLLAKTHAVQRRDAAHAAGVQE
jgi:KTSC domain